MSQPNDLSRSLVPFEQDTTLVALIELSQSSWLIAGTVPGVERQPLKKMDAGRGWRYCGCCTAGVTKRSRTVAPSHASPLPSKPAVTGSGWHGGWRRMALRSHVIHSSSVAVSREHRRAKTDRLDTAMLIRVFLGWLRGERGHCAMVAVPTLEEEDAKRPSRERENLVGERTRIINRLKAALARLGIRGFNPKLRKAPERLESLRTPEGFPIPPNTLDEMRRDLARLAILARADQGY